jgi:hypothetical protein
VTFPVGNQTVTAVSVTFGPPDQLGLAQRIETLIPIPACSFQPIDTSEILGDIDVVTSRWRLYAPASVNLKAVDAIITPWDGLRYDVLGNPMVWTDLFGRVSHQEVILRRATG